MSISDLDNFNKNFRQSEPFIRNKEGRLIRNPNYKAPESKKEEEKQQEIDKKQSPTISEDSTKSNIKIEFPKTPNLFKEAISKNSLSQKTQEYLNDINEDQILDSSGISGDHLLEPLPQYIKSENEKVIQGENDTYLIFGRDRPAGRDSGYGASGDDGSGAIDLVVGRIGYLSRGVNENNEQLWIDSNYDKDAARIVLSQKTDIDENFNLAKGSSGSSIAKSAIGIKADSVRVMSREGIKLVTGVSSDKINSQGGEIRQNHGIDLISNNDDVDLQPIPKGNNLKEAIERLITIVDKIVGTVDCFVEIQNNFNNNIATHWHYSPFFGLPTTFSEVLVPEGSRTALNILTKVKKSLVMHKKNIATFKISFLSPIGKKYINSRNNNTN